MKLFYATTLTTLGSILPSSALISIDANIFVSANHFGGSGISFYAFFNPSTDESDIVSLDLSSPSGGLTGDLDSASSNNFGTFVGLRSEIQSGAWTMTIGRDTGGLEPATSVYEFEVNVSGLPELEAFSILNPVNGATDVAPGLTVFEWTPPSGVYDYQGVDLGGSGSRSTYATFPIEPADSTWTLGEPGLDPNRTYLFYAQYTQELTGTPDVAISTPIDEFSNAVGEFDYTVRQHNEATSVFTTVPEPASWAALTGFGLTALVLVRRYRAH